MKICYLSDANSIHTKKFCDFFKNKGYDVSVISLNDGYIDGIPVYNLNYDINDIKKNSSTRKLKYILSFRKISGIIDKIKPDLIHAHYATSYGLLAALSKFHPFILSVWGSDVFDFPKSGILNKMMLKYNLKKADKVLSTSKVMSKETSKYTDKKIEITPFGVDLNILKPYENKYDDRDTITIGTIKTLEEKYGIEYLIRGFAKVSFKYPGINLILEIGGKGSQKEYLENLSQKLGIHNKVKFLGFLNRQQVVETFNRFDIAVFPSVLDSESFGVAAVEAQACGTPVIVSNVGGLPEATSPDVSSILVRKKNSDDIQNALEKLILNKDLRISMGKNARKFVEDNFNIEDNFNKVDRIYKEIINV
ncbi:MAG: glycosyltransferase [Clostridium tyrobutyricum]|jgi:glycosyltransferase involved in cell wall biosynthesis|uniref:glycosyltransferase n=1 Tax=Clostridium tyrobutyricum TaxID=1519 RepID=UPI0024321BE4|nr:glycosyltransferase [Clostridium tyrobutyricum]MCH4199298.1 glycosyltransferase [Clostridium tyrobutyricum]MCH4237385.1 glycosyltransferase [Clostridium tyrobutyricum]MCH4258662.1 glycosyltransferase [Clostridium tyrobutyricum]MCI1239619.1 glycosyltransferase [Clostridium tyrobutyricum]MCI1652713.1 glycosyltransferase [Clostridium tyrobutyricum]